jgi:hypothetical protein
MHTCQAQQEIAGREFVCVAEHNDHRHYFVPREDA